MRSGILNDNPRPALEGQDRTLTFFEDDPDLRNEGQLAVGNAFVESIQPVLEVYPELRMTGGSPQMQLSREAPEGSDLESPRGTIFQESGIVAGVFTLSRAPRDSD